VCREDERKGLPPRRVTVRVKKPLDGVSGGRLIPKRRLEDQASFERVDCRDSFNVQIAPNEGECLVRGRAIT
jgi:hypothetical protein